MWSYWDPEKSGSKLTSGSVVVWRKDSCRGGVSCKPARTAMKVISIWYHLDPLYSPELGTLVRLTSWGKNSSVRMVGLEFFHKDGFWRCSCNKISGTLHCLEWTWISWSVVICPCSSCWNAKEEDIFKSHIVLHSCIEIIMVCNWIQEVSDLGRGRTVAVLPEILIFWKV